MRCGFGRRSYMVDALAVTASTMRGRQSFCERVWTRACLQEDGPRKEANMCRKIDGPRKRTARATTVCAPNATWPSLDSRDRLETNTEITVADVVSSSRLVLRQKEDCYGSCARPRWQGSAPYQRSAHFARQARSSSMEGLRASPGGWRGQIRVSR